MTAHHVTIIAEAGVNHNGDIAMAHQLIDAAAAAGADYVKFQTFNAAALVTASARKAEYQSRNMGDEASSQLAMLQRLQLSAAQHVELIEHCRRKGIGFLSTAFDLGSVEMLDSLHLDLWKIPSGEVTNYPYLRAIARKSGRILLSTGMCDLADVEAALAVLSRFGRQRSEITLLHCTTQYPTPYEEVNLRAMTTLRQRFGCSVGYSDHTLGIEVPVAAVALGAVVIEKHFTLSRDLSGPDHAASLTPPELASMVAAIRAIEGRDVALVD